MHFASHGPDDLRLPIAKSVFADKRQKNHLCDQRFISSERFDGYNISFPQTTTNNFWTPTWLLPSCWVCWFLPSHNHGSEKNGYLQFSAQPLIPSTQPPPTNTSPGTWTSYHGNRRCPSQAADVLAHTVTTRQARIFQHTGNLLRRTKLFVLLLWSWLWWWSPREWSESP